MKLTVQPILPPPFIYATAMLSGGAIMVAEILGAKLLAPYVGTSHFVWLAQITVTLLALAFGYFLGGKIADKHPRAAIPFGFIAGAAIYLAASVPLVRPVAFGCLNLEYLAIGSLLASCFLFFAPLCLLAATAPFYVRLLTKEVSHVGNKSGRLSAAGTLGSVLGTVLVGYFVIPEIPNSATMYLTCGILLAWCVLYFLKFGRLRIVALILTVGLVGIGFGWRHEVYSNPFHHFDRLYRAQSAFGELQVIDSPDGRTRILLDDQLFQNIYDPVSKQSAADFTYMLEALSTAFTPKPERALCLGMGMGIVPMRLAKKGMLVDAIEINPSMVEPAVRFFDCDPKAFNLTIADARTFLNKVEPATYDTIILDVFAGDASPSHLFSKEAFQLMRRALKPAGTLVINTFGSLSPGRNFSIASLCKTLTQGAGFASVRIHADDEGGNIYVLAGVDTLHLYRFPDFSEMHLSCRGDVARLFNRTVAPPAGGIVLTDDFNPIEFYDAANREQTRRDCAMSVRSFQNMPSW